MKILTFIIIAALAAAMTSSFISPKNDMHMPGPATCIDGPYVFYRGDTVLVQYIDSSDAGLTLRTESYPLADKQAITLKVNTDIPGKTFSVKLRGKLENEKSSHGRVKTLLAMSDIEGEFAAFRKLLQGNGVIDENLNWKYGKNNLVLIGDFVDRGSMVTEVLWLIYALETQAEAAGGKVHYVLGNHEVMNMNGDLAYVHPRYFNHCNLMGVHYLTLFGPKAELGAWMATKNVVERVGNILFTHGGMSGYMNLIALPLRDLNDMTRPFYTDTSFKYPTPQLEIIYSDYGPFWYRGYYQGNPRATMQQVDSTLQFYDTKYVTTGHTVVSNTICSAFDGKVVNTDVRHAKGYSEALLVEDGKMFRVDANGQRSPLTVLQSAAPGLQSEKR